AAHEQFVTSHSVPSIVRPVVAASWRRSAAVGAGLDSSRLPALRAGDAFDAHRAQHPLTILLPLFRDLLGGAACEEDFLFAVADADGTLLWVDGNRAPRTRAERMHFVEGAVWSEAEVGTNAPGTALAVDDAVQIYATEHYNAVVQPWSCCAVPVHDADGRLIGVIDVTGNDLVASPQSLALVRATARAAEGELARHAAAGDARALRAYLDTMRPGEPAALITAGGRILHTTNGADLTGLTEIATAPAGPLIRPDGRLLTVERIGPDGHRLVRFDKPPSPPSRPAPMRLTALGRDCAVLEIDGSTHSLSRKHSEIVVALALAGEGASGGRLAVELSEHDIPLVRLRVEMSRLRALLGSDIVGSRPYGLRRPMRADFFDLRDLLAAGRVRTAISSYAGPLLPSSDAPVIAEFRALLEQQLRGAVLGSGDSAMLRRWVDAPWGADDAQAWRALADSLPGGSARRAAAAGRARALLAVPRTDERFGAEVRL
ncbi:MAG TPA: GAF domain-containing protein, partial [Kribbellaceae bacterium]